MHKQLGIPKLSTTLKLPPHHKQESQGHVHLTPGPKVGQEHLGQASLCCQGVNGQQTDWWLTKPSATSLQGWEIILGELANASIPTS